MAMARVLQDTTNVPQGQNTQVDKRVESGSIPTMCDKGGHGLGSFPDEKGRAQQGQSRPPADRPPAERGGAPFRKSIEHLLNIYRTSIERLSNIYRTSIEHQSVSYTHLTLPTILLV